MEVLGVFEEQQGGQSGWGTVNKGPSSRFADICYTHYSKNHSKMKKLETRGCDLPKVAQEVAKPELRSSSSGPKSCVFNQDAILYSPLDCLNIFFMPLLSSFC